jgi:hypothetical protein
MMKTSSANRMTKMKVIESGKVVKTVANASINYGQDLEQLKKMIEIAIRLSPQDPVYTVDKVCIEIGDGKYSEIDQNELVQIQNCLFKVDPTSANSLGSKVSLKVKIYIINVNIHVVSSNNSFHSTIGLCHSTSGICSCICCCKSRKSFSCS